MDVPQQDRLDLILMSDDELAAWRSVAARTRRVAQEERAAPSEIQRWTDELAAVDREQSFRDLDRIAG